METTSGSIRLHACRVIRAQLGPTRKPLLHAGLWHVALQPAACVCARMQTQCITRTHKCAPLDAAQSRLGRSGSSRQQALPATHSACTLARVT